MATYTISQAMSLIKGYLDKVANEAHTYMGNYIQTHADNPTGKLAGSLYNEKRGDSARAIGSRLEYAKYANDGRGPVHADPAKLKANPKHRLHWVYPRPNGQHYTALSVGPASGLHFIEKTKEYLETTHIPL